MTEYKHLDYSMKLVLDDIYRTQPFFTKKVWVPNWIWRLVANPDTISHVDFAMRKAKQRLTSELERTTIGTEGVEP